jgi:hypothetical protein
MKIISLKFNLCKFQAKVYFHCLSKKYFSREFKYVFDESIKKTIQDQWETKQGKNKPDSESDKVTIKLDVSKIK